MTTISHGLKVYAPLTVAALIGGFFLGHTFSSPARQVSAEVATAATGSMSPEPEWVAVASAKGGTLGTASGEVYLFHEEAVRIATDKVARDLGLKLEYSESTNVDTGELEGRYEAQAIAISQVVSVIPLSDVRVASLDSAAARAFCRFVAEQSSETVGEPNACFKLIDSDSYRPDGAIQSAD